jgi:hypothetical protein
MALDQAEATNVGEQKWPLRAGARRWVDELADRSDPQGDRAELPSDMREEWEKYNVMSWATRRRKEVTLTLDFGSVYHVMNIIHNQYEDTRPYWYMIETVYNKYSIWDRIQ